MPPPLPPPLLLRILHFSTSEPPTIDTLTHLWLALRPVCRAFRAEIEDLFLTQYLPHLEIRVAVYSRDIYQICDPKRILPQSEGVGRGAAVEKRGVRSEIGEVGRRAQTGPDDDDVVFTFSHTTIDDNATAIFTPSLQHPAGSEKDMNTSMALASLSSRFIDRLMVRKPTHVVRWYETLNDVFLPGLRVDLGRGGVGVEWRGLVGGVVGEERGVEGVRRGLVGAKGGVGRGLCEMGGGRGESKAGPATRSGVKESVHESPVMDAPMAKKRRSDEKGKGREGVRRRFARDEVDVDLMNQLPSASPVVIDLDPVETQTSPSRNFDFDIDRNLDMDLSLDYFSEADWEHIPPPPHRLDSRIPPSSTSSSSSFFPLKSNDFGCNFSSCSPPPLPFSLSPSPSSSPSTSPAPPSSHSPPQPPSPSPTLYSQYPSHYPLPTPPPPPIPANALNWDIDPARLEARRRRVAHLFRKFCTDGKRDIRVGNVSVGENDIGREMEKEIRGEIEREMGYRGWIMGEWCAVERVRSLRMEVGS